MSNSPKLTLTTGRQAMVAVLAGAVVCGLALAGFEAVNAFPPVVPWSVPVLLLIVATAVVIYARVLPKRIEEHKATAQESVVALSIGKSTMMTGAVLAGAHVVYVARYVHVFAAALPSQRVIQGAATIVTALLLAGAGALLERACIVRDGDDDEETGTTQSA